MFLIVFREVIVEFYNLDLILYMIHNCCISMNQITSASMAFFLAKQISLMLTVM